MSERLARDFTHLRVYQRACGIAAQIFETTRSWPREEAYAFTHQVRRASRSIGAQIAEAWGKRRYPRHFLSKLTDADAEQLEARHWIKVALDCGYLNAEEASEILEELARIGRMLNSMKRKSRQFCGGSPGL
ncbi:MAG: four helix bundle protein [Gemmatimonadales bacterium]|jgi:four helix bundle protein